MALYCITTDKLEAVPCTSFVDEKILERRDLQRLLKADIAPLLRYLVIDPSADRFL